MSAATSPPGPTDPPGRDGVLRRAARAVRPYVTPVLAGLAVTALCAVVARLPPPDSTLAGVVTFGAVVLLRAWDRGVDHSWPEAPALARRGARQDMTALSWSLTGRGGRVSEAAVRRLREDARRRLALRGVHLPASLGDLDRVPATTQQEARRLLGPAWPVLTAQGDLLPTMRDAEVCVAVLEQLVPATTDDGVLTVPTPPRPAPRPASSHRGTQPTSRRPAPPRSRHT